MTFGIQMFGVMTFGFLNVRSDDSQNATFGIQIFGVMHSELKF